MDPSGGIKEDLSQKKRLITEKEQLFNSTEKGQNSEDCRESFLEGTHWKSELSQVNTELDQKKKKVKNSVSMAHSVWLLFWIQFNS